MTLQLSSASDEKATIFKIDRFALHDGPGIRTLVFFKGCPLKCFWCSTPESQAKAPQIGITQDKCSRCQTCIEVCPEKANAPTSEGKIITNRAKCLGCGICVRDCPTEARVLTGSQMSLEEMLKVVMKNENYYRISGGGVTLGGGEPLAQPEIAKKFLKMCKKQGLHTAIETSGYAEWEILEDVLEFVDWLFMDIKHMDPSRHKMGTGVDNAKILSNLRQVSRYFSEKTIVIRTPVVPGFNDSEENIEATAKFLSDLHTIKGYQLLGYHKLGESKYEQYDIESRHEHIDLPRPEAIQILQGIVDSYGLRYPKEEEQKLGKCG